MTLQNNIEIRDSLKDVTVKVSSKHKMRELDLLENAIMVLKKMAKTVRDSNVSSQ